MAVGARALLFLVHFYAVLRKTIIKLLKSDFRDFRDRTAKRSKRAVRF